MTASTAGSGRRRWTLYAAAWLPMLAAYFGAIMAGGDSAADSLLLALHNTVPAALAGIGVVFACARIPWGSRGRGAFLAIHAGLAAAYSLAWCGGMIVTRTAVESLWTGRWRPFALSFDELRWQLGAGVLLYLTIASVRYVGQVGDRLREQEARAARAEALRARAEMQALRAQINPHFLFNTLHSLLELVSAGDGRAEEAIERFGALLHRTCDVRRSAADDVPVDEEIQLVRDYLWIEQLRLGTRLIATLEVDDDALRCTIPTFVLQPLVENAVKHAASTRVAPTSIRVRVAREGGRLLLSVVDDGPGAIPERVERAEGAGLRLVRGRVEARYGDDGQMRITTAPGAGFCVALALPAGAPALAAVGQG
ncbi:MAG TPA: histidine kinase [Longimicrobium sp.]|uniref:sensor histidine kinase n=1 Tax=Longimicrobium sp. TaxID=2029185 RepID=UPI002ED8290B